MGQVIITTSQLAGFEKIRMQPRGVKVKDHGSMMLSSQGPWLPRVAHSSRLAGVGIEHNARALITCMALGIRAHRPSPHHQHPSAVILLHCTAKPLSFLLFVLQSLSGHV